MQRLIKMISTPLYGSDIFYFAWFVKPSIIWCYFASQFYRWFADKGLTTGSLPH